VSLRPAAESSTGYLRMKSCTQDDSYLPMNVHSNDYVSGSSPSYLIPQSAAQDDDDDDDDEDVDVIKTLQPAAAANNLNDSSIVNDSAEKPLLNSSDKTAPHMKYSALQQYSP